MAGRKTPCSDRITATRPKHFFRNDSGMPEVVSLNIARPRGFEDLGHSEWANLITERVRSKEADHRQRRAAKGITVLTLQSWRTRIPPPKLATQTSPCACGLKNTRSGWKNG